MHRVSMQREEEAHGRQDGEARVYLRRLFARRNRRVWRRLRAPLARLRAWWFRRQGLTPRTSPERVVDCLRQAGWLATAGSTGLYLSMRARMPRISRRTPVGCSDRPRSSRSHPAFPSVDEKARFARRWQLFARRLSRSIAGRRGRSGLEQVRGRGHPRVGPRRSGHADEVSISRAPVRPEDSIAGWATG